MNKLYYDILLGFSLVCFVIFIPPIGIFLQYTLGVNYVIINIGMLVSIIGIGIYVVHYLKTNNE